MNKLAIIPIFITILLSCSDSKESKNYSKKIKGDWITDYFKNDFDERILIFTFQDSTCSYLFPYDEYSTKYKINSDTLVINEGLKHIKNGIVSGKEKYYFKILSLDNDNLLISPTPKTIKLIKYFEGQKLNTIRLKRVIPKMDIEIERIGFFSTMCHGTCPSMYLEIDSIGNILFNGRAFTSKDGLFSGKIPDSEWEIIKKKIQNIEIGSLEERYLVPIGVQTRGVKIKSKDKEFEISAYYEFGKEPVELRILFHKLMEIYELADLEQDSTIKEKFEFKEFLFR